MILPIHTIEKDCTVFPFLGFCVLVGIGWPSTLNTQLFMICNYGIIQCWSAYAFQIYRNLDRNTSRQHQGQTTHSVLHQHRRDHFHFDMIWSVVVADGKTCHRFLFLSTQGFKRSATDIVNSNKFFFKINATLILVLSFTKIRCYYV